VKKATIYKGIYLKTKVRELSVEYKPELKESIRNDLIVGDSEGAVNALYALIRNTAHATYENLYGLLFNIKNAPLGYILLGKGSVCSCASNIRLLVQAALLCNAVKTILIHNHPSGGLTFSKCDYEVTKDVKAGLNLFDIILLDHILVSFDNHVSMRKILPKEEIRNYFG